MKTLADPASRRVVESRQNARVKELRAAFRRAAPTADARIAIEGEHLLQEAAKSGLRFHTIFVATGHEDLLTGLPQAETLVVSQDVFASAVMTEHPQGIAALVEAPRHSLDSLFHGTALLLVACGLQDPGNLGTLVRSAEAFGATGIISLPGTVSLWNAKTLRASSGSAFRLPHANLPGEQLVTLLKDRGVQLVATVARNGAGQADLTKPSALLLGNEGAGLPDDLVQRADTRVTIRFAKQVESLNAAVAGSILLHEAMRQRTAATELSR